MTLEWIIPNSHKIGNIYHVQAAPGTTRKDDIYFAFSKDSRELCIWKFSEFELNSLSELQPSEFELKLPIDCLSFHVRAGISITPIQAWWSNTLLLSECNPRETQKEQQPNHSQAFTRRALCSNALLSPPV